MVASSDHIVSSLTLHKHFRMRTIKYIIYTKMASWFNRMEKTLETELLKEPPF